MSFLAYQGSFTHQQVVPGVHIFLFYQEILLLNTVHHIDFLGGSIAEQAEEPQELIAQRLCREFNNGVRLSSDSPLMEESRVGIQRTFPLESL